MKSMVCLAGSLLLHAGVLGGLAYVEWSQPDIPEPLEKILQKGLERNLSKRYQDAGKMGYDLEYFMYHKGYGPTIVTLEKYMRNLFPHLYLTPMERQEQGARPLPQSKDSDHALAEAKTQIDADAKKPKK
jgi:hypothetical protein